MKISEIIANFLVEKGIRHVFGIVGAGNAHLFDSIASKGFTSIICVHHEQAACMAAQAYYRISGILSAAIVTTGAGSTNAVTGVVSAWMDSIPCLVISGNENSKYTLEDNSLRIWGVQGYDSVAMVSKVTKYAARVLNPNETLLILETAYYHALNAKPGPCWIDFPMNIQALDIDDSNLFQHKPVLGSKPSSINSLQITNLYQAASNIRSEIVKAQRPVIWLGHGVRLADAVDLIEPFINFLQCPVLISWAGIDMISSDHPLVFGRAGVYGQRAANFILQNCDFLLAVGTRLAIPQIGYDLNEFIRNAKLALVDIDLTELQKLGKKVSIPIQADAKDFMQTMLAISQSNFTLSQKSKWLEKCDNYRNKYPILNQEYQDRDGYINSYTFIQKLSEYFTNNQIIVTDMGTALLSTHQILSIKKGQRLITSTGLGEMGYALPAAIGAAFANKNAEIICLNCDGGMMLNLQELQTIVHHRLPIKIVVFNNDGYLMIKHTQKALFSGRYAGTNKQSGVSCPDFSALAQAFGIPSFVIRSWEDVESEIPKVQNLTGPVICEVFTHPEQLFSPKLSLALQKDGSIVSPPLEDLSPLLPREELAENMLIGLHPKSEAIEVKSEFKDTSVCG
ncbi:MAG TPA: thiamine pyrophosphate-binding protein [Candidatus Aquirickettsiella sp.]|jgi:acetolactate synthase-1/2/3 large subunit